MEMGRAGSDSDDVKSPVDETKEAEIDPWALTDLVDTSEKWSGN
jgi:hypothetical protein